MELHWEEKDTGKTIILRQPVPAGHKIALEPVQTRGRILRYGQVIGFATSEILPGEHVHTHNVGLGDLTQDRVSIDKQQLVEAIPVEQRRTFRGFRRSDGRVGTRNTIAVVATVNCSAHACRAIARHFTPERLEAYDSVDGVSAFVHRAGCAQSRDSDQFKLLQRTLCGIAQHPNVGGTVFIGLGCETNSIDALTARRDILDAGTIRTLVIQDVGGLAATIHAGIEIIEEMLPRVNSVERTVTPISELTLALQCGGSDSWSGITANPLVGHVSDEIVRQGGTVVLAETPEILGAEHLLTRRAASPAIGRELLELVDWWRVRTERLGITFDDNRSAGNEAGGLTTIYEKALGGVAKGGSSTLNGTYRYAERITARGLTFMNTPGFDPTSVTGQIAGGCNLVLFTTGRGSVFGSVPAPTIKISTNSTTYNRLQGDMDFNAGRVLEGTPMAEAAEDLLDLVVAVANGKRTKSEAQGTGEAEFSPWDMGQIL
jgi:altronate hydrolase